MADSEEMETIEENEDESCNTDRKSSDDSDSSSDENYEQEERVAELQKQISKNPYLYDTHVKLVKLLKTSGELEQLREARSRMSELFPLTEELWLDWIHDEIKLSSDDRTKIIDLFETAVRDYLSVNIWIEYVQFSIGGMSSQDGIIKVRETFEKALTATGLHVTQGSSIWEAYREFENAILSGIMPAPGQVATKQQEEDFSQQHKRIVNLFKRQLSVPLNDMEETFIEFKEWLQEDIDKQIMQAFQKALDKYNSIKHFEDKLLTAENRLATYLSYIDHEVSCKNPARVICLFERAIKDHCLEPEVWIKYTNYINSTLKNNSQSIAVFERAVRNCPWNSQLWSDYLLTLERAGKSHSELKVVMDRGLSAGFSEGPEYLQLWSVFCDSLRRRIQWDQDHTETLDLFRSNIEKAVEHLSSFPDGDPTGSLRQFWANIEAKHCKNVTKGRELWNEIMTEGHGNEAAMWLGFYHFERCYGDNKHCRKVLQRALNSVSDWPDSIVNEYINFEREEGDLEQYEQAVCKCNAQMERIQERRRAAAEKEELRQAKPGKKQQKSFVKNSKSEHTYKIQQSGDQNPKTQQNDKQSRDKKSKMSNSQSFPVKPYQKHKKTETDNQKSSDEANSAGVKRKAEDKSEFKVPPPPGFKGERKPPPGYNPKKTENAEPPSKVQKTDDHQADWHVSTDKSSCTAFVSNLSYDVEEEEIKQVFSEVGEIVEVRLIKNFKGKSKGYAYVEFQDELCAGRALKLDHTPINGRPMYVSRCEEKSSRKPHFKFATSLEKNKLFVKGLPFTCTKEDLTEIFSQHGKLKDVRIVTYRSGAPKGLAYVEYEDETTAAQAVLKVDGLKIGDHSISVAISNPPDRKMAQREDDFIPSLGGGKKETEIRGKARTQVALLPRKLTSATASKQVKDDSKTNTSDKQVGENSKTSTGGKSNEDFRKMLLGMK